MPATLKDESITTSIPVMKEENILQRTWHSVEEVLHLREPTPPPVPPKDEKWLVKTVDLSLPHDQEPDPSFWDKIVLKITSLHSSNQESNEDEEVSITVPTDAALQQLGVQDDDHERQEKSNYFKRMSARCKEKFEEDRQRPAGSGALMSPSALSVHQESSDQHHHHSLRHLLPSYWVHHHRDKHSSSLSPKIDPKEMKAAHAAIYPQSQESNDEDEREGHRLFGAWWGCHDNRSASSLDKDIEDDWEKINLPTHKDEKRRSMGEQNGALPIIYQEETGTPFNSKRKWWKHKSSMSSLDIPQASPSTLRKEDQKAKLKKHQAIAQAAAYEAMKEYQARKIRQGKKVSHGEMKAILAGMAMAEAVKLLESRLGSDDDDDQRDETVAEAGSSVLKLFELLRDSTLIKASPAQRLDAIDEQVWLQMGSLAESMGEIDRAMNSYESALRHNHQSINALSHIAELYRSLEDFPKAANCFKKILAIDNTNGRIWGSLGHCYLMMDELQKAYAAYQNALVHLPNPKDAKLWFGIGILYDRYGSVEHAEEAFSAVLRIDPKYEKANEVYFRLGIIYKGQQKYAQSLECFRYILSTPPRPLTEADIWFQIGHVHEQQKEYTAAREAYERVLAGSPNHARVLQQLGWLYHQKDAAFVNQEQAIEFLTRSIEVDNSDAQSWYLMGRCYMAQQKHSKAYEAYQQAVYRDSKNATFWCSIGLLYFQISQYRDALDAYSKAIRINPNISEVWIDLGALYEACNNQVSDAIDAYQRALELDPENLDIKQRLTRLRNGHDDSETGGPTPSYTEDIGSKNQHYSEGPNGRSIFSQMDEQRGQNVSSSGYMVEERQPQIPKINVSRPPTPAGNMMSRGHSPHVSAPSVPAPIRSPQGTSQSPALDKRPYGSHGSPMIGLSSNRHNHGSYYPPSRNIVQTDSSMDYDQREEEIEMKQDRSSTFQHKRRRSDELTRPINSEQSHSSPHAQQRRPSDPYTYAQPPSGDERRSVEPLSSGPDHYHQEPWRYDESRIQHNRHSSDDRSQEKLHKQQPNIDRDLGSSQQSTGYEKHHQGNPVIARRSPTITDREVERQERTLVDHSQQPISHPSTFGDHPDDKDHKDGSEEQNVVHTDQEKDRPNTPIPHEVTGEHGLSY
ncbi:glucose repression mediator protein [Linnemannia zychae]|nr:glucose repression mediator protein [Linnemannia zychae]